MNMQNLMAQAQKMQKDIQKKQAEIEETIFEGKSEWVDITMSGKREIKTIKINKNTLTDQEDIEILEDMIMIAMNDALKKVEEEFEKKLGAYGSGLSGLM